MKLFDLAARVQHLADDTNDYSTNEDCAKAAAALRQCEAVLRDCEVIIDKYGPEQAKITLIRRIRALFSDTPPK